MSSRLTQIDHSKGSTAIVETDYTLNAVGNRTQKLSAIGSQPSATENYTYDNIDPRAISDKRGLRQVPGFTRSAGVPPASGGVPASATYQYDAVGNRTNVTGSVPGAGSYAANNLNQYTSAQGKVLLYDGNGNLSQVGLDEDYSYDSKNRLLSATKNDAQGTTNVVFAYDNRNRQVSRTVNSATSYFIYDNWSLIAEYDDQGGLLAEYIHGGRTDEILAKIDTSGTVYYHHDGLGSTVALTDELGVLVESYTYDVFGAVSIQDASGLNLQVSAFGNRFLFTGREYIAELGLYDYRNRVYSPELGRFLQTDPIRFNAGDVNLYRYVGNNAVNAWDPDGLETILLGDSPETGVTLNDAIDMAEFGSNFKSGADLIIACGSASSGGAILRIALSSLLSDIAFDALRESDVPPPPSPLPPRFEGPLGDRPPEILFDGPRGGGQSQPGPQFQGQTGGGQPQIQF